MLRCVGHGRIGAAPGSRPRARGGRGLPPGAPRRVTANVTWVAADVTNPTSIHRALAAWRSSCTSSTRSARPTSPPATAARASIVARAAAARGVRQIVYLGGLGDESDDLSDHLQSRRDTERYLASGSVPLSRRSARAWWSGREARRSTRSSRWSTGCRGWCAPAGCRRRRSRSPSRHRALHRRSLRQPRSNRPDLRRRRPRGDDLPPDDRTHRPPPPPPPDDHRGAVPHPADSPRSGCDSSRRSRPASPDH